MRRSPPPVSASSMRRSPLPVSATDSLRERRGRTPVASKYVCWLLSAFTVVMVYLNANRACDQSLVQVPSATVSPFVAINNSEHTQHVDSDTHNLLQSTPEFALPDVAKDSKVLESPGRQRTLIMYATTGEVQREFAANIESFLALALLPYPEYHFIFIIQGCHRFIIDQEIMDRPNFEVFERPNVCYDAGAWLAGIELMDSRGVVFDRYVLLNRSVRGPFIPNWAGPDFDWVAAFGSQLNEKVKLVGTTLNCGGLMGGIHYAMHLQSMALITDAVGMSCCVRPTLETPACTAEHELSKHDVIMNRELKLTVNMLNAGHSIATMMLAWRYIDISLANDKAVQQKCEELLRGRTESDLFYPKAYQGIDFHPLELMFFKTTREITPDVVKKYTEWHIKKSPYVLGAKDDKGVGCAIPA